MNVQPIGTSLGAEITGLGFSRPLDDGPRSGFHDRPCSTTKLPRARRADAEDGGVDQRRRLIPARRRRPDPATYVMR